MTVSWKMQNKHLLLLNTGILHVHNYRSLQWATLKDLQQAELQSQGVSECQIGHEHGCCCKYS